MTGPIPTADDPTNALQAAVDRIRLLLEFLAQRLERESTTSGAKAASAPPKLTELKSSEQMTSIGALGSAFGLTAFERDVVLLCAASELDPEVPALCARILDEHSPAGPTLGLAAAALPEAHWSAFIPSSPLRRYRLIRLGPGPGLTSRRVHLDESVLHFLMGEVANGALDPSLAGVLRPISTDLPLNELPPTHQALVSRVVHTLASDSAWPPPIVCLTGDPAIAMTIASTTAAKTGRALGVLLANDIPSDPAVRQQLVQVLEREALLGANLLLVDCLGQRPEALDAAAPFLELLRAHVIVRGGPPKCSGRELLSVEIAPLTAVEQRALWHRDLRSSAETLSDTVAQAVATFDMSGQAIAQAAAEVRRVHDGGNTGSTGNLERARSTLWLACRQSFRGQLDELADRIEPRVGWDALVLPSRPLTLIKELASQVRQRSTVLHRWGFASRGGRGLGVSALFAGPSGTGKTLAAEVLAHDLARDLYRIDLSSVVSKYIGETEKNLQRIFEAADGAGAILLFDEADALFGSRSQVRDAHDRYANVEISFLLQRMESYSGLAILTTNLKQHLDSAFLRRLRFLIDFPFPDESARRRMWESAFPKETPRENLRHEKLARLDLAGGSIRNVALNAAFRAAEAQSPVTMQHIRECVYAELEKLGQPASRGEIGGWE